MKSHTKYLTLTIPGKMTFVNITAEVAQAIRESGVQEGIVAGWGAHISFLQA